MFKKLLFVVMLFFLITSALFAQQRMQDVVYLKDGSIIHGTIIEQVPNVSLKVQTKDGNVFVYSMDNVLKITKEPYKGLYEGEVRWHKSPGLAFALSFLFPGIGQYYNGDVTKGVIQEVLYVGGWVLFFALGTEEVEGYYYDYTETTAWWWIGLGLASGSALWSMIDAPISANKINKKSGRYNDYGHLLEFNQGKNVIGFDLGPTREGLGAKISYHF